LRLRVLEGLSVNGSLTTAVLRAALERICARLEESAGELNSLDGALGDGDLGVTMVRGARSLAAELPTLPEDLGMALAKCAQAFTKTSGSTFGTLLATGLMSAAKTAKGRTEVPWTEMPSLLGGALAAMSQRGRSQLGEKTVLDAVEAARAATEGLDDPALMVRSADEAVAGALERLRGQTARQGRARIFGEKSAGRDDPGMVVFKRILEALRQA
jgi:dihydroxyacetone kinase-like protein